MLANNSCEHYSDILPGGGALLSCQTNIQVDYAKNNHLNVLPLHYLIKVQQIISEWICSSNSKRQS